jgi:3-dehydroquinate synthase
MKVDLQTKRVFDEAFPQECYNQVFSVPFEYPVYFTRNLFAPENELFAAVVDRLGEGRRHRLKVFVDSGLVQAMPGLLDKILSYVADRSDQMMLAGTIEIVPGGEKAKSDTSLATHLVEAVAESRLCRQSYVLVVGGGSVLDLVGLASSLVHRGVRLIRVPSTVLAQNDAGVGVKNGIDVRGIKNFAGTFAPPFAVLNDYDLLRTLPKKYWLGGIAEAFKVGIIKDDKFFDFLRSHAKKLRGRDEKAIEWVVKRCALLHLDHIRTGGDPFELGSARPLDFGHWSAHKLEVLSDYQIGHGQAVSIGIALDTYYACLKGFLSLSDRDLIIDALEETGLPLWHDLLAMKTHKGTFAILQGIHEFQKHLGGRLRVTLPKGIGDKVEVHDMDPVVIEEAIDRLHARAILHHVDFF